MTTEFLTDWEVLAVEKAVRKLIQDGDIHKDAEGLLTKLEAASHIRLTNQGETR